MKKEAQSTKNSNSKFDFRTITSFEKACEKENLDPLALPEVSMIPEEFRKAIIGAYKLFIIFKAINNGWIARMGNSSQLKYEPWLRVRSSGCGFDDSLYYSDLTHSTVGSRLCTFSAEAAIYIGKQFGVEGSEYKDFFLKTE